MATNTSVTPETEEAWAKLASRIQIAKLPLLLCIAMCVVMVIVLRLVILPPGDQASFIPWASVLFASVLACVATLWFILDVQQRIYELRPKSDSPTSA